MKSHVVERLQLSVTRLTVGTATDTNSTQYTADPKSAQYTTDKTKAAYQNKGGEKEAFQTTSTRITFCTEISTHPHFYSYVQLFFKIIDVTFPYTHF